MNKLCKLFALTSLTIASINANAELIKTDWKTDSDSMAVVDTTSGKEWLNFSATRGLSIAQVQAQLDTTFAGWRLPTRSEIEALMGEVYPDVDMHDLSSQYANIGDLALFSNTFGGGIGIKYNYGMYLNDEMDTSGGGLVRMVGTHTSLSRLYYNYDRSNTTTYSQSNTAVYLISDGGTTLTSKNDPSINVPDIVAPSDETSVPVPASLGLLGLAMAGFGFRRKSK